MYSVVLGDSESIRSTYIRPPAIRDALYNRVKSEPIFMGTPAWGISRVMTARSVRVFTLAAAFGVLVIEFTLLGPRTPNGRDAGRHTVRLSPLEGFLSGLAQERM